MLQTSQFVLIGSALLTSGLAVASFVSGARSQFVVAQSPSQNQDSSFPDVRNNWAQPFIAALAERDILNGYPDGNYRPTRPVGRDEFAAIIRSAFNQNRERQLSSGSAYRDVPKGYWAESAIEEAYEMGFMRGYSDQTFRPRQPISRAEVLTALARNLELAQRVPTTPQSTAANNQARTQAQSGQAQPAQRRSLFLPLAAISLMQPLMRLPAAQAKSAQAAAPQQPQSTQPKQQAQPNAREVVQQFYSDADQIPQYAIDAIAATTKAGIVVNHPNLKVLNPNQPATRSDVAAFIHQALVNQNQLPPLANEVGASRFIVGRDQINANRSSQN